MPNYNNKSGANGGYRGQGGRREQDNRNGQRQNNRQPRREEQVTLTAPYQFAELNKDVYFPGWASQVSQDIPFYDGIDGVIEVTLMNVSPLFTRNGTAQNEKDVLSAHVMEGDQRRYIIPATTIKGMLRSTMEIMSFAKMNFFDDRYFAYREIASEEYRKIMAVPREGQPYDKEKIGCGWLRKEGDTYYLKPCKGRFERITHKDIESLFHVHLDNFTSSYERNAAIAKKNNDEWYPVYNGNYQIVCTGKFQVKRRDGRMEGKQKEYLFPREYEIESPVKKEIIKKFLDAHEGYTPRFKEEKGKTECYLNLLKKGHSIAVFFLKNPDGSVKVIGLSRMLRYPYEKGVEDIVSKQQPAYNDRNRLDLCEAIWGYTGDKESLKGRVQIGHVFCHKTISDNQLIIGKGTLGEPKASFYPLYLKQDKNAKSYKKYSDATEISGRKLYKIHKGSSTTDLPQGNSMTDCEFNAIPSGQLFTFKIHVHNIRPIELGALLCALTLNQTKDTYHNIGLAKAYGYGKIQITSLNLAKGFDKKPEDYMREFEIEMSKFTWKKYKKYWVETQPLHCIASILQEHEDGELRTLELKEFGIIKKPKSPVQVMPLNEGAFMNSFITDIDKKYIQSEAEKKEVDAQSKADIERQKLRELYSNANALAEKQFYEDAIKQMEQICDILEQKQITDLEKEQCLIANWKKKSEEKIAKEKAELKRKQEALMSEAQHFYYNGNLENAKSKAQEALAIYEDDSIRMLLGKIEKEIEIKKQKEEIERSSNERFNGTLKTVLYDKATSLGNIIGTTKKWLSFDGHTFTDEEYEVLKECIGQLPDKEKKSLMKKQKELVKAIGKDYAEKLLKDLGFIK